MTDEIDTSHFTESTPREKLIEHLFLAELLRALWRKGIRDPEVLRAEVDRGGFDIVLDVNGIMRHIQLKASYVGAKTSKVPVNTNLAAKPHGCVIWIFFDPETLNLGPYLWFGGRAGTVMPSLGDRVGRHTRGTKGPRPKIRVLGRGVFTSLQTIDALIEQLFGLPGAATVSAAPLDDCGPDKQPAVGPQAADTPSCG